MRDVTTQSNRIESNQIKWRRRRRRRSAGLNWIKLNWITLWIKSNLTSAVVFAKQGRTVTTHVRSAKSHTKELLALPVNQNRRERNTARYGWYRCEEIACFYCLLFSSFSLFFSNRSHASLDIHARRRCDTFTGQVGGFRCARFCLLTSGNFTQQKCVFYSIKHEAIQEVQKVVGGGFSRRTMQRKFIISCQYSFCLYYWSYLPPEGACLLPKFSLQTKVNTLLLLFGW